MNSTMLSSYSLIMHYELYHVIILQPPYELYHVIFLSSYSFLVNSTMLSYYSFLMKYTMLYILTAYSYELYHVIISQLSL